MTAFPKRILVATDSSDDATLALRAAADIAIVRGEWPPSRIVVGDDLSEEAGEGRASSLQGSAGSTEPSCS